MNTNKSGFEITECSRCGGSGKYSYNMMDGDRCFGCRGSGYKFTKRGLAARKLFHDLTTVAAGEVQPGWILWDDTFGYQAKWLEVKEVQQGYFNDPTQLVIETRRCRHIHSPESQVRAAKTLDEVKEKLAIAVASQSATK